MIPPTASLGLFSSLLGTQQTKSQCPPPTPPEDDLTSSERRKMERIERLYGNATPKAEELETNFRHSGWWATRQKVRTAMVAANLPAARIERFDNCGAECRVEYCKETGDVRFRAFYCGDRFCIPCTAAKARRLKRELLDYCKGREARFLSITARPPADDLKGCIDGMGDYFSALRRCNAWTESVDAGCYVMEVKKGEIGRLWHVHFHALVVGRWIDQEALIAAWKRITNGSWNIDIRATSSNEEAVEYCGKYMGKGFDHSVFHSPDDLLCCLLHLRGRRLLSYFGEWWGMDCERNDQPKREWKSLGRLGYIASRAVAGEQWACGIIHALGLMAGRRGSQTFVCFKEEDDKQKTRGRPDEMPDDRWE